MTIAQGLLTELRGDAGVSALVGTRVWQEFAPQNAALPYITFQRTSTATTLTLDGVDTLRNIRYQLDIYAATIASANAVKSAVGGLLDGKSDTLDTEPIEFCYIEGEQDLSELEMDGAKRRVSLQLNINAHEEY